MALTLGRIEAPQNLSQMVYASIKRSIMNMDWSDVSSEVRLDERTIAHELGVSRTPLREAIKQLVIEGFLRIEPRKGLFVIRKSKTDMIEIMLVRLALEGFAARLATKHATKQDIERMKGIFLPFSSKRKKEAVQSYSAYSEANIKFHELILQLSNCKKLIDMASVIFDHVCWIRSWSIYNASFEQRFLQIHKDHLEIISAIEKGDSEQAERRMRAHIERLIHHLEQDDNFPA